MDKERPLFFQPELDLTLDLLANGRLGTSSQCGSPDRVCDLVPDPRDDPRFFGWLMRNLPPDHLRIFAGNLHSQFCRGQCEGFGAHERNQRRVCCKDRFLGLLGGTPLKPTGHAVRLSSPQPASPSTLRIAGERAGNHKGLWSSKARAQYNRPPTPTVKGLAGLNSSVHPLFSLPVYRPSQDPLPFPFQNTPPPDFTHPCRTADARPGDKLFFYWIPPARRSRHL